MMKKAIILLSGGLDSATCLALAKSKNYECYALSLNYGQKHNSELKAAENLSKIFDVRQHETMEINFGNFGGSALTDEQIVVNDYNNSNDIPNTYVPARNTIMLSLALGWAEIVNANSIFIGVSSVDYSGYPDCRSEYIEAFRKMANLATKSGIEGQEIQIATPLIHLSKAETIKLGASLGLDYSKTISCYRANDKGLACGTCDSCYLRKKGFIDAGVKDPTNYQQ